MPNRKINLAIFICFLFSGISGLIYEVVWAKYFALIFGSTAYAHTLVLATFMGGLALGSFLLGRLADRIKNHLAFYALLEISIAIFCALTPRLFDLLKGVYLFAAASLGFNPFGILLIKFILGAFIMLVPTVLMGGTLPVLAKYMIRSLSFRGETVARLYYINSFGAVLGTLLAGFYLIYHFGLEASIWIATLINFAAGVAAFVLSRFAIDADLGLSAKVKEGPGPVGPGEESNAYSPAIIRISLAAIFFSGVAAMFYELVWIRLLSQVLGSSTYSFSLMLAAFISGITLGSFLISRFMPEERFTFLCFGLCEAGIAFALIFSIPLYERLPFYFLGIYKIFAKTRETFALFEAAKFFLCFLVMVLPTIFLGMALPLASRIATCRPGFLGKKIGGVFAFNTIGNILGALLAGLMLIPLFGLKQALEIGIVLNLVLGCVIFWKDPTFSAKTKTAFVVFCFLFFSGYKMLMPEWNKACFAAQTFRGYDLPEKETFSSFLKMARKNKIVFYKDGVDATVAVNKQGGALSLLINGKADASTSQDMPTQMLCAHLPLLLKPGAKDMLIIGLGSGVTCGSALTHPVESLDLVEISSTVVEANSYFAAANHNALQDKRLHLYVEDAKTFIKRTKGKYDIIISEPSNPWMSGVGNLFSEEYFRDCLSRLKDGGAMVQWVQAYEIDDEAFKIVLRTFHSVFPEVTVWQPINSDIIMIGSQKKISPDLGASGERIEQKAVREDLARIQIHDLLTILSLQISSGKGLDALVARSKLINSDYYPVLEYKVPYSLYTHAAPLVSMLSLDERKLSLDKSGLLLKAYLQGRKIDDINMKNLYLYFNAHLRPYNNAFLISLAQKWIREYPEDDGAIIAYATFNTDSLQTGARLLEKLVQRSGRLEYLDQYAKLQIQRYVSSGSFLLPEVFSEAVEGLKTCIGLSQDRKAYFYYLLGQLYFEGMDYRRALNCYANTQKLTGSKEGAQSQGIDYGRFLQDVRKAFNAAKEPDKIK